MKTALLLLLLLLGTKAFLDRRGDLNLAILNPVHPLTASSTCRSRASSAFFYLTQVARLTVDAINADPSVLPNLTLGYVLKDTCQSRNRAMRFAVSDVRPVWESPTSAEDARIPVFGFIGCQRSECSIALSSYLQIYNLSLLSTTSTAVELSNKQRHPFFLRLVPNSKEIGRTIAILAAHFGWHYLTLIFESTASNQDIVRGMDEALEEKSMRENVTTCFSVRQALLAQTDKVSLRRVVAKTLSAMGKSRVVLLLTTFRQTQTLLREFGEQWHQVHNRSKEERPDLIFVFADSFSPQVEVKRQERLLDGALHVNLYPHRSRWAAVIGNMTFADVSASPWAKDFLATKFRCSWGSGARRCGNYTRVKLRDAPLHGGIASLRHFTDFLLEAAIHAYARAVDALLRRHCPEALHGGAAVQPLLRRCVTGRRVNRFLVGLNFSLPDAFKKEVLVFFDANGDPLSSQILVEQAQFRHGELRRVASFSVETGRVQVEAEALQWPPPLFGPPNSVCGRHCGVGFARVRIDRCCWTCHRCERNQRVAGAACESCPALTWPNASRTACLPIPPSPVPRALVIGSVTCAGFGVLLCVLIFAFMLRNRHSKLIRATSLPISLFLLACIMLLFVETLLDVMPPTDLLCLMRQFAFPIVYTLLYAALLARTLRIFLIFRASDRLRRPTRLVDNRAQAILILALLGVQAGLLLCLVLSHDASHVDREMPNPLKPRIHVICRSSDLCLHLPTFYNTVLILVCACLGFVTRRLPDNFRETMCLFLCSCSTLLLWACFFPVYSSITAFTSRSLLQLLILHLSAFVYLSSLFLPKVYAVWLQGADEQQNASIVANTFEGLMGRQMIVHGEGRFSLSAVHEKQLRRRSGEGQSSPASGAAASAETQSLAGGRKR